MWLKLQPSQGQEHLHPWRNHPLPRSLELLSFHSASHNNLFTTHPLTMWHKSSLSMCAVTACSVTALLKQHAFISRKWRLKIDAVIQRATLMSRQTLDALRGSLSKSNKHSELLLCNRRLVSGWASQTLKQATLFIYDMGVNSTNILLFVRWQMLCDVCCCVKSGLHPLSNKCDPLLLYSLRALTGSITQIVWDQVFRFDYI